MKIKYFRVLAGPNIFSYKPLVVMGVDLEDLDCTESHEVPGLVERFLAILPGLREHHCAFGAPGGFVQRLYGGTYMGHVIEHVALEFCQKTGIDVNYGKTVSTETPHVYDVMIEFKDEETSRHLLRMAFDFVTSQIEGKEFPLEEKLRQALELVESRDLGPSTRALVTAAEKRKIPWKRIGRQSLIQLGYGMHRRFLQASVSSDTSAIAVDIAQDKDLTKHLLEAAHIPVPAGTVARNLEEALEAFEDLPHPLVVKPLDGHHGQGVTLNIRTQEEFRGAFARAREYSSHVVIERVLSGKDYRVLVIGGKVIAAAERIPASVQGDGESAIRALIEKENKTPERASGHCGSLTKIEMDHPLELVLGKQNLRLDSVPEAGKWIPLRETANLSTGGTARDVTGNMHESIRAMCERASRVVGLDICGLDLITEDISKPLDRHQGGIVEVNAGPGLRMHLHPTHGSPRDVADAVINAIYPPGAPSRIPIVSITGTNGKTTTTRLIGHILSESGKHVGMTSSDGIYIARDCIHRGDMTGPLSAHSVLSDPAVEVAVLETARGGILCSGLGYDWSDVGVLTNIQPDHIGQNGIQSIEDIRHVKSLVAERVREGGTLVLNAEDRELAKLTELERVSRIPKNIVYFALSGENQVMRRHVAMRGTGYYIKSGWVVEACGQSEHFITHVADVPVTLGGKADFQVQNVLAAIAGARGLGVSLEKIVKGLMSFQSAGHNRGRLNFYRCKNGYVLVDYGHNPDAIRAISRLTGHWPEFKPVAVLGVPGDRADHVIRESGREAARGFQKIILKEDMDLRGRPSGQVADLLAEAIREVNADLTPKVRLDEGQALTLALTEMHAGDLVCVFYDHFETVTGVLEKFGAEQVESLPSLIPDRPARRPDFLKAPALQAQGSSLFPN